MHQQMIKGLKSETIFIRAPFSGTVANLAFNAVGEVVRPADTILEIVPADDRLVFEGRVPLTEIDRVRVGQSARIRLSALNQATTPELTGRLIFVSADPVTDPSTGVRTFRVRVAPDRASSAAARRVGLISGMPAELFITAGSRSLWSYIFKPMRDQFARAFRD